MVKRRSTGVFVDAVFQASASAGFLTAHGMRALIVPYVWLPQLDRHRIPTAQWRSDITTLYRAWGSPGRDGRLPLEAWLDNARTNAGPRAEADTFERLKCEYLREHLPRRFEIVRRFDLWLAATLLVAGSIGGAAATWALMSPDDPPRASSPIALRRLPASGLCVAQTEVTVGEYADYLRATGVETPTDGGGEGQGRTPLVNVTHREARRYAEWLSEATGIAYRLPTATEWEAAARASPTGGERAYPWGGLDDGPALDELIYPPEIPLGPVGSVHDRSGCGIEDMGGGVAEWTDTSIDAGDSKRHVICGGWARGPLSAFELHGICERETQPHDVEKAHVGFRLVVSPEDCDRIAEGVSSC